MISPDAARSLSDLQQEVALRVLAEEEAQRRHVVVSLSGAHAYGFPSPDSDLDVKAVHIDPTIAFLGFGHAPAGVSRMETVNGVEVDYSSNELGGVLLGVLKGNGNYIERFLSGFSFGEIDWAASLRPLVQGALSKRIFRHYNGFATQQRLEWEQGGCSSAKKLLYVLRTTLTGAHALSEGEIVTDLTRVLDAYGFSEARELVEQKRRGERSELPQELSKVWQRRMPEVFELLTSAHAESKLPEEPANSAAIERWLVERRLAELERARG